MVIGLFGGKKRTVVNGAKETVYVGTDAKDVTAPMWFADCFLMSRAFSKGDRSALLSAIGVAAQGKSVGLLTAEGTVNHELYQRLVRFGYLEQTGIDTPGETVQWELRPDKHAPLTGFIAAIYVDTLIEKDLIRVSKGFAAARGSLNGLNSKLLGMMRNSVLHKDKPFADGSIQSAQFKTMAKLKLIYEQHGTWWSTALGTMTLPYLFDHLMNEKRLWLEEKNA